MAPNTPPAPRDRALRRWRAALAVVVSAALVLAGADIAQAAVSSSEGSTAGGNTVQLDVAGQSFVKVFSSSNATTQFALTDNGQVYGWGYNGYNQLATGNTTASSTPVLIGGALTGKTITQVAVGNYFAMAMDSNRNIYAWGDNTGGEYGNGTLTNSSVPVQVPATGFLSTRTVQGIAAGVNQAYAWFTDGTVAAWGYNDIGQLGIGYVGNAASSPSSNAQSTPTQVGATGVLSGKLVTQVATGNGTALAVTSDGGIYAWGNGNVGALGNGVTTNNNATSPISLASAGALSGKRITQVAEGDHQSLALGSDGTLYSWGNNACSSSLGQNNTSIQYSGTPAAVTNTPFSGKTITQIASGYTHDTALASDGTAYAWGCNESGELGTGNTTAYPLPVVAGTTGGLSGKTIVSIAAFGQGGAAVASDGTAFSWGSNSSGQLGIGTTSPSTSSSIVADIMPSVGVTFGGTAATGVTRLGPTSVSAVVPAHSAGTTNVVITVGGNATYPSVATTLTNAYTYDATPTITTQSLPNPTVGIPYSRTIATSGSGTITFTVTAGALPSGLSLSVGSGTISGTPTVAGASTFQITATNATGSSVSPTYTVTTQAGASVTPADGAPAGGTTVQVGISGMSFAKIFSSEASYASFGLTDTGALYAWGWNASGQLGIGSQTNASLPTPVGGALAGKTITQLVQGQKTTLALASDNTLYAWGDNTYGEYGNGTTSTTPSTSPVQIPLSGGLAGKTIAQIASGSYSMIAVATDGTVATWGYGGNGQLGNNTNSTSVYASTPVAINSFGALASLGSGVTITRVAMSDNDTFAVASNNAIYSWGAGVGGQLGNNTSSGSALVPGAVTTSGTPLAGQTVAQIVASTNDAYVLTGAGSLVAWGFNDNGQIGNGSTTATPGGALLPTAVTIPTGTGKTITQIGASGASATLLTQDGTLYAWGSNGSGQLGSGTTTNSTLPTAVNVGGKTVSQVAGNYLNTYAIATDGSAYAVGRDSEGNLGNNTVSNASAVTMTPVTMPAVALSFGGTAATSVTRTSASTVSAVTPAHASGVVNVIAAVGGNALYPTVSTTLSNAFTYDTAPTITTSATLPGGIVGSAYSQTAAATATGAITWTVTSGALPAGLTLNAATGVIAGTPTTAGTGSFTLTATTAAGTDARAFTLAVAASPVVSSTPSSLADPVVGTAYSATFTASGTGPYTYTVTSGAVPAGLTLVTATGVLSGTPTTAGAASFVISATSSSGTWASSTYSVTTRTAAAITTSTLPDPVVGQNYSGTVTATGSGPLTYSISAGTLPDGLTIASSTGAITGQPTTTGSSTFTVSVAGPYGAAATRSYTVVTRAAPTITTATLPDPVVGVTYPGAVVAAGSATITYAVISGTIPAGLSFDTAGGGFTGTPTTAGTYSFVVRASNTWGATSTSYSVTVRTAPVVTTTTLPNGLVGSAYSGGTVAASGSGSMSFAVTAGSLPAGLTLTATSGAITGTPTAGGTSAFSITATSAYGTSSAQSLSILVKVAPTITTTTLPNPTLGVAYSQTVAASGDSTISFAVTSGTLPAGLTVNTSTGVISGTTTSGTSRTFTVTATNSSGSNAVAYTLVPGAAPAVASGSLAGAVVGAAYSQSVATSGDGAVTYTVASGTLPTGLTLVASSGVISGTPTAAGTFTFTTTATSQYGTATSTSTQIVVLAPPSITTTTLPDATVGTTYSATVAASGSATITFAVTSGTLPAGLSLDGSTGIVSGTPTTPGAATFTVTATSSAGSSSRIFRVATFTAPTITTGTVPDPLVGTAYSVTIVATGSGPISFAVTSGALPAGLSLVASTGVISGTPTTAGAASFSVSATSAYGSASTQAYSVTTHSAPAITSSSLATPVVGAAYSSTVGATGSGPLTFAATSGALPAGLALNTSTGEIAGTPTATGSATFTITVTSPYGSASQAFTLAPTTAATITTASLANPTVGTAYSATIAASGGGSITFAVTAGALPAGLSLTASNGVIAGTATSTGASTFTVTATNGSGSGTAVYTLTVGTAPVVSSATLADPVVGATYSGTVAGSGSGVITFAVTSGALPTGLALTASTGALTGTPTTAGSATFTVTASSEYGSGTGSFTVIVRTAPAITTLSLASPTVGASYSATVAATGSGPIAFAVSTGSLPAGLALTGSTGAITGTATTTGSSTFTISATSASGSTAQAYTLVVGTAPAITSSSVPDVVVGTAYTASVTASGSPTITFAVTSGALPAGVILNASTGGLSGTPTTAGSVTFAITASSTYGSATQSFTVVARTAPAISTLTLADPTVGSAYSATVATTGTGPITFSVASGALPAGLTLDTATGVISGTPTVPGSYSFTIAVTSASGSGSRAYRLVAFTPPVITTTAIPVPVVGAVYSATIVATGSGPITFSVSSGTLPTGLALNASTGVLSGTPTTAGSSTFTVLVTSAYGTDSRSYTVGTTNLPSISTTSLADAIVGSAYSATVVATGSGSISFAVSSGTLPAGLSLNTATGEISGTATTAASSTFTIQASNTSGSASQSLTILARTGLAITTASLPNPTVGAMYSATVAVSGSGSIAFSVSSGTLPTGLVLGTSSGLISGTPTAAGSFTFVVTATSSSGSTTRSYTVVAGGVPSVLTTSLVDPSLGLVYGATIVTTGGGTPTFAVSTGALPAGVTLNPSTGVLSGVPTTAGAAAFAVSVTTEYGTAQQAYSVTVRTLPAITTTSLPDPVVGTAYTATVVSTGSGPLTFAVSSGVLPPGVVLDTTSGVLSGTPTTSGSFPFVVIATSAYGVASRSYRLVTFTAPTITTSSLDGAVVGTAYSTTVAAAGSGPIVFALAGGTLPTGLSLDSSTGVVSGTPTAAGSSTGTVTATSAYGSASHSFTVIVRSAPSIITAALADPVVGAGYTATVGASGSGPVSFSIASGSLPAGLGLDAASGSISGTPVAAGAATFTVTATNLAGFSTHSYTLTVHLPPTITTASVADALSGNPYTASLAATGDGPLTYAVASGALPAGLSLSASGVISGTPTAPGTSTFGVSATSSYGVATSPYTITVRVAPSISTTTLADGLVGSAYSGAVVAAGSGSIAFSMTSGALPAGLSLNPSTGALVGTPTVAASSTFTITATTPWGTAARAFTMAVHAAPTITANVLPSGVTATAYSATIGTSGSGSISVTVSAGTLPDGLALDSTTGVLSGTPTTAGSTTFTATATNAYGSATQTYTLTVLALSSGGSAPIPAPVIVTRSLAAGIAGDSYSAAIGATNALSFGISSGLPAGLSFDATTGVISGTPNTAGTYTFSVTVVGVSGTASADYSLTVWTPPSIVSVALPDGITGAAYAQGVQALGDGAVTYGIARGALPAGLGLDSATGAIFGTPTGTGTAAFTISATSPYGTASASYSIAVHALPRISTQTIRDGVVGTGYQELLVANGSGPVTFAVTAGALPSGVTLGTTTGLLSGTPAASGIFSFTVSASNPWGSTTTAYTLPVLAPPSITTTTLAGGQVGVAFAQRIAATGDGTIGFGVTSGALPAGLSLDSASGVISGTPTAVGSASFIVTASSVTGSSAHSFTIDVAAAPPVKPLTIAAPHYAPQHKRYVADAKVRVTASGLVKGEKYRIVIGKKVVRTGVAGTSGRVSVVVKVPATVKTAKTPVKVLGATHAHKKKLKPYAVTYILTKAKKQH